MLAVFGFGVSLNFPHKSALVLATRWVTPETDSKLYRGVASSQNVTDGFLLG